MKNVHKFVSHEVGKPEDEYNSVIYQMREKLNSGEKLTTSEGYTLFDLLYRQGYGKVYRLMGYQYDFSDVLKTFLVKTRDYGITEMYAPSKMAIRKVVPAITKIIEL